MVADENGLLRLADEDTELGLLRNNIERKSAARSNIMRGGKTDETNLAGVDQPVLDLSYDITISSNVDTLGLSLLGAGFVRVDVRQRLHLTGRELFGLCVSTFSVHTRRVEIDMYRSDRGV